MSPANPQIQISALLDAIPMASLLFIYESSLYKVQEVNMAYLQLTGLDKEAFLGKDIEQLSGENTKSLLYLQASTLSKIFDKVRLTGEKLELPLHPFIRNEQGDEEVLTTRNLKPVISPLKSTGGSVEYLTFSFLEVTDGLQLIKKDSEVEERDLESSKIKARFDAAQHMVSFGYWEYNPQTGEIFWSNELSRIYGLSADQAPLTPQKIDPIIHPDDLSLFKEHIETSIREGKMYDFEHRIVMQDGTVKYILSKGHIVFDEAGTLVWLEGIAQDITDRKLSEIATKESEEKYKVLFYDSPLPKWVYDRETLRFLEVNRAAVAHYGYTEEEFLQMTIKDIRPQEDIPLIEEMNKRKKGGINISERWRHKKKSGEIIYTYVSGHEMLYQGREAVMAICHDLTEMVQTQEELAISNERFKYVMRATNDAVWDWNGKTNKLEWGEGYTSSFGYKPDQYPASLEEWLEHVHPEDKEKVNQVFKEGVYESSVLNWQLEYRYKKADDSYASVLDRGFVIRDEQGTPLRMIGAMQNITEQKMAEERLRSSEEFRSLVINSSLDAIICSDTEGNIILWNPAAENIFGWSEKEMLGKPMNEYIIPEHYRKSHDAGMAHFLRTGKPRIMCKVWEMSALNRQGQEFPIEITIVPIQLHDRTILCGFIRDISYRKQAERLQQKMTQDLYEQNRDLQQFTYIISHNLRAPVANAMGLVNLLSKDVLNPEIFKRSLSFLKTSLVQLDTVLKDVSLILSIRDSKDVLEKEQINLIDVMQPAFDSLQEALQKSKGSISLEIEPDMNVNGNRAYLHSIFYNLLSNAIKYRSEERTLHIQVKAIRETDGGVRIIFSDNGSGFDMEKAGANIFKLYKRFHMKKKGRGIGLFLIKTHVEAMGGQIEVKSEVNVGTTFTISLP